MILPPSVAGVAFSEAVEGDMRGDPDARKRFNAELGLTEGWATVGQVHGSDVVRAVRSGLVGQADAVWTTAPDLPVAVFTADCFGVVVQSDGAVGVAHAGWRGALSGVVPNLVETMTAAGYPPRNAHVGPGIMSCCFSVGSEVYELFPDHEERSTEGIESVDLPGVVCDQLAGLDVGTVGKCTGHNDRFFSFRRDGTYERMVTLAWVT